MIVAGATTVAVWITFHQVAPGQKALLLKQAPTSRGLPRPRGRSAMWLHQWRSQRLEANLVKGRQWRTCWRRPTGCWSLCRALPTLLLLQPLRRPKKSEKMWWSAFISSWSRWRPSRWRDSMLGTTLDLWIQVQHIHFVLDMKARMLTCTQWWRWHWQMEGRWGWRCPLGVRWYHLHLPSSLSSPWACCRRSWTVTFLGSKDLCRSTILRRNQGDDEGKLPPCRQSWGFDVDCGAGGHQDGHSQWDWKFWCGSGMAEKAGVATPSAVFTPRAHQGAAGGGAWNLDWSSRQQTLTKALEEEWLSSSFVCWARNRVHFAACHQTAGWFCRCIVGGWRSTRRTTWHAVRSRSLSWSVEGGFGGKDQCDRGWAKLQDEKLAEAHPHSRAAQCPEADSPLGRWRVWHSWCNRRGETEASWRWCFDVAFLVFVHGCSVHEKGKKGWDWSDGLCGAAGHPQGVYAWGRELVGYERMGRAGTRVQLWGINFQTGWAWWSYPEANDVWWELGALRSWSSKEMQSRRKGILLVPAFEMGPRSDVNGRLSFDQTGWGPHFQGEGYVMERAFGFQACSIQERLPSMPGELTTMSAPSTGQGPNCWCAFNRHSWSTEACLWFGWAHGKVFFGWSFDLEGA